MFLLRLLLLVVWHCCSSSSSCHCCSSSSCSTFCNASPGAGLVGFLVPVSAQSVAQISLRFLLEKGIAAIPSASTAVYMLENLNVHDFGLTVEETVALSKLAIPCRGDNSLGLQKCWADPAVMICMHANGSQFHCP